MNEQAPDKQLMRWVSGVAEAEDQSGITTSTIITSETACRVSCAFPRSLSLPARIEARLTYMGEAPISTTFTATYLANRTMDRMCPPADFEPWEKAPAGEVVAELERQLAIMGYKLENSEFSNISTIPESLDLVSACIDELQKRLPENDKKAFDEPTAQIKKASNTLREAASKADYTKIEPLIMEIRLTHCFPILKYSKYVY
ncbi:MAG: hypothetical protein K1X53_10810 [Candidatus Sumerlaeaceae bacterium]|nr:hypothetical protein [Candidatus Sumerlaeaceae bacterium]